ncbi:MAG: molybdate ABC transporter substrate-binding protein [Rhodospirillales bacterium]
MMYTRRLRPSLVLLAVLAAIATPPRPALADDVRIATAANFTAAAKQIGALFENKTGHKAIHSFGSTGLLYTQISQGAPFEVFLAADRARPKKALKKGFAVPGSRFTYATGRIVLFSPNPALVAGKETLTRGGFTKIAIANPLTAPYGKAAVRAMRALGVYDKLKTKIVQGNNIAQTYQFVKTGNAEIGFVALSQVAGHDQGSRWIVPDKLYPVIAQDAVLLKRGAENKAARAYLSFLKSPEAAAVKKKFGYGSGAPVKPDA